MTGFMKSSRAIALLAGLLGVVGPVAAELPLVEGKLWNASSLAEKRAYLIGIANTVAVERAVIAKKTGTNAGSMSGRMSNGLSLQSIDSAVARIDDWYKANPGRSDMPVLGVIWMGLVKGR